MSRLERFRKICAGAGIACLSVSASAAPNVLLVMTDDQGYGDLGCHGNAEIRTPNLDRLHGESVRFTDFHVSPTCSPTRAALMTGRYNNRVGVWHTIMGRSILPGPEVTMAEAFGANGYRTGMFGKWHLGDNYPSRPQDQGFDTALVHGGGGVGQLPDYWGNDYFDDTYWRNGETEAFDGYCTDVWFDGAMEFIEQDRDQPFFCYLATNAPHGPYLVADSYRDRYRAAGIEEPRASFYGMIENIDDNMGRLLERLEALDIADNTILIFMTDNGTAAGFRDGKGHNAGMRGTKGSPYDGGHRVPFFVRWPNGGIGGGRDVDALSAHIDVLPTLLDLCGLDNPRGVKFDGVSLSPVLKHGDAAWPARALIADSQRIEYPEEWRQSAVMTERWRLVNGKQLFEIESDPGQELDVASSHPDTVAELREAYLGWWKDISPSFDGFPRVVIGGDAPDRVMLTSHDWHGEDVPWNQGHVLKGMPWNGTWKIEVAERGAYDVSLYRWPPYIQAALTDAVLGGASIAVEHARLSVGAFEADEEIVEGATNASFRVSLEAGPQDLRTTLIDDAGAERGAYFVVIEDVD